MYVWMYVYMYTCTRMYTCVHACTYKDTFIVAGQLRLHGRACCVVDFVVPDNKHKTIMGFRCLLL